MKEFKTTNVEAPKKHGGDPYRCPSVRLGRTVPSNLILKQITKTKTIIVHRKGSLLFIVLVQMRFALQTIQ